VEANGTIRDSTPPEAAETSQQAANKEQLMAGKANKTLGLAQRNGFSETQLQKETMATPMSSRSKQESSHTDKERTDID